MTHQNKLLMFAYIQNNNRYIDKDHVKLRRWYDDYVWLKNPLLHSALQSKEVLTNEAAYKRCTNITVYTEAMERRSVGGGDSTRSSPSLLTFVFPSISGLMSTSPKLVASERCH